MSSIGTFGSFTQARLAIYTSYAGLSVTGNNIANINTDGYTRQKLYQTSFYAGGSDRYYSTYDVRIGNGVLARSVNQLRDPYLDIRYRNEMSGVGAMDTKLAGLEDIQRILDEVGDGDDAFGVLEAQFSDFVHQLQMLNDQTGLDNYDIQVRASAEALVHQFNTYASQLQQSYENSVADFKQDVTQVNTILSNIRDLNSRIRKAEVHGDNALELRDERNLLIDELSSYMKIDVTYTEEDIGCGVMVEKLTIKLGDANPDPNADPSNDTATLVDGIYARQFSIAQVDDGTGTNTMIDSPNFDLTLSELKDAKDRLMYTITRTEGELVPEGDVPNPLPDPVTDPLTGITTITTYTKTTGTITDPNDATATVPAYLKQVYEKRPSTELELADNDLYGSLQSQRELLTEKGEFASQAAITNDPNAATKRGIPYYQKALDLLANQFAKIFNEANLPNSREDIYETYIDNGIEYYKISDGTNGSTDCMLDTSVYTYTATDGTTKTVRADMVTLPDDCPEDIRKQIEDLQDEHLSTDGLGHGVLAPNPGGILFSSSGDEDNPNGITASNISISKSWSEGPLIVNSFDSYGDLGVGSTDGSNILHMIALMDTKMKFNPKDIDPDAASTTPMFHGTFNEMWVQIGSTLGNDMMSTTTKLDAYYASSVELDTSRDSVSSVDLNDEAMNLMQYSKSYNAACRLMTTLDSVLDKLINGTGATV